MLNPAGYSWLFRAAKEVRILLAAQDLTTNLPAFIDLCKQRDVEENGTMRNLLWAIQQAHPSAYRALADFVATMMDVYSASLVIRSHHLSLPLNPTPSI